MFWAAGSRRPAGITLPGNGSPVCGSLILKLAAEKSPPRIASVGTVAVAPP